MLAGPAHTVPANNLGATVALGFGPKPTVVRVLALLGTVPLIPGLAHPEKI